MNRHSRSVLITGGTGSIGQSLVRCFAKAEYQVVFQYYSNEDLATQLCLETAAERLKIDFLSAISLPDREFDVIINSAGILITKTLAHEVTLSEWQDTFCVNTTAPFLIIRKYLPNMMQKNWGRIINVGSIYSLRAVSKNSSYNASKHALSGLMKSIAKEYASFGITCNEICPSATESEIMDQLAARKEKETQISAAEYLKLVRADNPTGRMALPRDITNVALFLASDESEFINGQSIVIDGGQIC